MASKKVVDVSEPKPPERLCDRGIELWQRLTAEYDFAAAPEKLLLLEEAARTADIVDRLQRIVDEAQELGVRGSQGQPVSMPEVQELRQYRAQLAALVDKLRLPEYESESARSWPVMLPELGGLAVGRVRRHHRLSTPEILAAALPAELNMLECCGTVEGLRAELRRISVWLDEQVPGRGADLLVPVLEHVGFDLAGWYRRALSHG